MSLFTLVLLLLLLLLFSFSLAIFSDVFVVFVAVCGA